MARTPISLNHDTPKLSEIDNNHSMDREHYEQRLEELSVQLVHLQQAYKLHGKRAIIVFEGIDAAGKGGIIWRLTRTLDPRGYKVWPIGPPEHEDRVHHYLYRFWKRLPEPGSWAIFDRSWYGRVLVERVNNLAAIEEWQRAYAEINEFERMLFDDGIPILKFFLVIDQEEQYKRFLSRLKNPNKRWKLTVEDIETRKKWDQYQVAYQDMLDKTSTEYAPWQVIPANNKKWARIEVLQSIYDSLSQEIDISRVSILDPEVKAAAIKAWGKAAQAALEE